jgi:hypothetical protein
MTSFSGSPTRTAKRLSRKPLPANFRVSLLTHTPPNWTYHTVKFCWMLTWSFPESTTVFATLKHATTFTCLMDPRFGADFPYISRVMGGWVPTL